IRLRREMGIAGPSAIVSASAPSSSACRPAVSSRACDDGVSTVTSWPRARSPPATPATCSLTSWGCDQSNGETRQMRNAPPRLAPAGDERPRHVGQPHGAGGRELAELRLDFALAPGRRGRDVARREHAVDQTLLVELLHVVEARLRERAEERGAVEGLAPGVAPDPGPLARERGDQLVDRALQRISEVAAVPDQREAAPGP